METIDKDEARRRIERAAWPEYGLCPSCGGSGKSNEVTRRTVHTRRGGLGADWDIEDVLQVLPKATRIVQHQVQDHPYLRLYFEGGALMVVDL